MRPVAILDCCFNRVSRRPIREHYKTVAEVFMDVSTHQCVHRVTAGGYGDDVLLRQSWQDKSIRYINAELITASAATGMAVEACVQALGRVSALCLCGHASP
jgi:hypothetical protein